MVENIIAVDENDIEKGTIEKIEAHLKGILHRAFSIFVFNSKKQLLLQKREKSKYHSGGLWSNTCCSHPRQGEALEEAVHRRLKEEMGFDCELNEIFSFIYNVKLENNIVENEYDHVFIGKFNGDVKPNDEEVEDFIWIDIEELRKDIEINPQVYTFWFRHSLDKVIDYIEKNLQM